MGRKPRKSVSSRRKDDKERKRKSREAEKLKKEMGYKGKNKITSAEEQRERIKKRHMAAAAFMGKAPHTEGNPLAERLASPSEKNPLNALRLASPLGSLSILHLDMPPSSDSPPWVCTPPRVPSPELGVAGQSKLVGKTSDDVTSIIDKEQRMQESSNKSHTNSLKESYIESLPESHTESILMSDSEYLLEPHSDLLHKLDAEFSQANILLLAKGHEKGSNRMIPKRCSQSFDNESPSEVKQIRVQINETEVINNRCNTKMNIVDEGRITAEHHRLSKLSIQGSFHQGDDRFGNNSGKQCVANCLLAIVKSKVLQIKQWNQAYLDSVLIDGNELYSLIHGNNEELLVSELPEILELSEMLIKCYRKESYGAVIDASGIIDFSMFPNALPLDQALQESLIDNDGCFICVQGFTSIAIQQNGKLYLFDSHARNSVGFPDIEGKSLLMELKDVSHLYELLCNFAQYNDHAQFEITGVNIEMANLSRNEIPFPHEEHNLVTTLSSRESLLNIEESNSANENNEDDYSDVEIITDAKVSHFDFSPIDKDQKRKLCTVLDIPLRYVSKAGNCSKVINMGHPSSTKTICGDGNCLFRAISYAVSQRQQYHQKVRHAIVNHSLLNCNQYNSFVDAGTVSEYIYNSKMIEENVWGTAFEILVASDLLKTDIYTYFEGKWHKYSSKMICKENVVNEQAIYLKHIDNHYEVVTSATQSMVRSLYTNDTFTEQKRKNESTELFSLKIHKKRKLEGQSLQSSRGTSKVKREYCDIDVMEKDKVNQNDTDVTGKKTKTEKEREKYHENTEFRHKKLSAMISKYAADESQRQKKIGSSKTKYATNESHKQNVKESSKAKYATDDSHRQSVKESSKAKYATDDSHRQSVKESSKAKYATDDSHRQSVKESSKAKYATDDAYRQNVKELSKNKYAKDDTHRQNVKDSSKHRYRYDLEHQQKVRDQNKDRRQKDKQKQIDIGNVTEKFRKEAKKGPEYVCSCCFRLFFKNQVKVCRKDDYASKNEMVKLASLVSISEKYKHICSSECEPTCRYSESSRTDLWICITCHRKILSGKIPAESHTNNLELEDVPKELSVLNSLEQHLIALTIPFIKVMGLPKGGQKGVHGPVVCVPSDLNKITTCLPRCDDDNLMLRVKLKRKISYKGYEEYQFVSPKHLEEAFALLKEENIWFSDVSFSNNWQNPITDITTDFEILGDQDDCTNKNQENQIDCITRDHENKKTIDANERCEVGNLSSNVEAVDLHNMDRVSSSQSKENENNNQTELDESYLDDGLRGIQLDTCLQPDDIGQEVLDTHFDKVFNVSPGEGNNPISVLQEDGIEAKSFPVHYPTGKNTLTEKRDEKLSLLRYFNLRLTSVENRFARDTSYIFFSQYLSELDRIISNVQISLRKQSPFTADGKCITSSTLCNKESLKDLFKKDEAIKYLKPVRGTPPYWQATQKDIFAMIRQLGIPTFFCSFSSADFRWPEMIETIMKQQGDSRSIEELDWNEKCKILRSNPVTVARMFDHRFHIFLHDVILSDAQPIGKVIDFFYRIEFQQRGSPHTHCLFWIEDAPKFDEDDDDVVIQFIDKYITCEIPNEEDDHELHEIVKTVHQHSKKHSKSCRKKGTVCRFNFPRPPSTSTFIARKNEDDVTDETYDAEQTRAKERLTELWNCIVDGENEGMDVVDLFEKICMTQSEFEKYYSLVAKRNTVVLKRKVREIYTNQYNKDLLRAWNANMDIQPVLDAYSCIVYMITYISKAERELGTLLQQTKVEAQEGNLDAQHTMKKIGTAYMHHREISAQEAVFRVTGLKLKECSRNVQFIPIGDNPCRMSLPLKQLAQNEGKNQNKDDSDEDGVDNSIWMTSIVDRYKERPLIDSFESMCLAEFCSAYSILSESQVPKKINRETTFQLGNNMGYIRKRTKTSPAVIRYPRFSVETSPEKFYQTILQLFLPHRQEKQLKPPQFETFENFYKTGFVKFNNSPDLVDVQSIVNQNREQFVKDEQVIDRAENDLEQKGIQDDAWGHLFPESEVERHECIDEGSKSTVIEQEENSDITIPDLNKSHNPPATNLLSMTYQTGEIVPLLRALNMKQRKVFYKIREWCIRKVNGESAEPFHVFITGGGGTGKSHLIKCLYYEANRILARSIDNPDDITVLLSAPTGTAAFNINGMTIHSALSIFKTLSTDHATLSEDKINTLRSKLESLHILIIDEVSMVNKRLLFFIHERLRQVKKMSESCLFGGVSVIAVGDFYQLPPVKTKKSDKLYVNDPSNPVDQLWNGLFELVELDEMMRQREDSSFAEILNRLRVKEKKDAIQDTDVEAIQRCMTEGPDEALHIFATNDEVRSYNNSMIMKMRSEPKIVQAEDYEKVKTTGKLIRRKANFSQSDILLPTSLLLAEGARVMLTKNIDTQDGLVNGVMGTVVRINQSLPKHMPEAVFIRFDNDKVGKNADIKKCINGENCVGLKPSTENVPKQNGSRKQYPLQLAWACTVHKVQGLTVEECVVALNKCFSCGQAYVALSRVTSMNGLHIKAIDEKGLNAKVYCDPDVRNGLLSMKKFLSDWTSKHSDSNKIDVMYHNIQGLKSHIKDLVANPDFRNADCICLTETWLKEENTLELHDYKFVHMTRYVAYDSSDNLYKTMKEMQHGGVGMFFKTNGNFEEVTLSFSNLECVVLKIISLNVIIATLYRTKQYPIQKFQENLAVLLEKLFLLSDKLIIIGDFNQDILKKEVSLKNLMLTKGFQQLVQSPTTEGRTLIDHIYCKGCSGVTVSIMPTYYSYHDAISIKLNCV